MLKGHVVHKGSGATGGGDVVVVKGSEVTKLVTVFFSIRSFMELMEFPLIVCV